MSSRVSPLAFVLACVTAGVASSQNDECTGALALRPGATAFNTAGATTSFAWPCTTGNNDIWFVYTPSAVGALLTFETCGSGFDTTLQVFRGTCASLTSVACNDDGLTAGPCPFTLQSYVSFVASASTYYVRVGGFNGATGAGVLNVTDVRPNDECIGAVALGTGGTLFHTFGATTSSAWPCVAGGNDAWYTYVPSAIGALVTIETCGAGFDTALEAFTGSCAGLTSIACNDDATSGPCAATLQSRVAFVATAPLYYIRVGGVAGSAGAGVIEVDDIPPPGSGDIRIVDCLPGTFRDISGNGTALDLANDGEVDITTTVGNAWLAAGTARVGSNGAVRFAGAGTELGLTNGSIPNDGAFGATSQVLMPFWDDIDTAGGTIGNIYWQELAGTLYVQWEDVGFFNAVAVWRATFQLQVHSTGPALAQFLYTDVQGPRAGGGDSATIGYQDGGVGSHNAQYGFNAPSAVRDGAVLSMVDRRAATTYISSQIPGTWIDISSTGTALNLFDELEVDIPTTVGNGLLASGVARVGCNGAVRFGGTGNELGFTNAPIPSPLAFSNAAQVLMPFWDDIDTLSGVHGNVYWQEVGHTLIIQWHDVGFFLAPATERASFQIQVFRGGPLVAQFLYQDIEGARAGRGNSATIGYQSSGVAGNDSQWSFNTASVANGAVLSICYIDATVGTAFCSPTLNSTGRAGVMFATGSKSVATNDLVLNTSRLPLNAFGYFLTSATAGNVLSPGGFGNLCLVGQIGRYIGPGQVQSSGTAGSISLAVDLTRHPTPTGLINVAPGETWSFQTWHRDSVGGFAVSNFTSALQIQFSN